MTLQKNVRAKGESTIQNRRQQQKARPKMSLTGDVIQKIAIEDAKRDGWQAGANIIRIFWPNLPKYAIDALLERRIYFTKDNKVKQAKKTCKKEA